MVDSNSLASVIALLTSSASYWLPFVRNAFLDRGTDIAIDKALQSGSKRLHFNEKEQLKHLKRVLRNAAERSLLKFNTQADRDQLRDILSTLSEQGTHFDTFRKEIMRLLTLSDSPSLEALSELYNHSLRFRTLNQANAPQDVNISPYLSVFFEMLKEEFFSDTLFHDDMYESLNSHIMLDLRRSCTEVIEALRLIGGTLANDYTTEQFEENLYAYITHVENTLKRLKLVGVVPKDRGSENVDPELELIFVPLQIAPLDSEKSEDRWPKSITAWLEDSPYLVLLGGPGTGKSTATRFLAWSHAIVNLPFSSYSISNIQLLSKKPLPLRIELRRLVEDRRQFPTYDLLDYTTDILLRRAGVQANRLMFEELLERRLMLCLFDGLDEVATLDDRQRLITEIEEFARCYPGNYIIVTSRPVGYELARFSKQTFSHAQVKEFDNRQIRTFLERWYTHVLKLEPIPPDDQQELEVLYKTLKENSRLHTLATNPLLLTVITALHRYERLPDRRILVYDRCAELLLDTWAKLKGTDSRWKDMRMGKEDQNACVAHLGFVLHSRAQEDNTSREMAKDFANDVTSRFIVKQIEYYLNNRGLISEVAEQRIEAERFLNLMQIEAGLIVERGKDENGDALYGFVHRTFQEYFAAADVYERYLQEENPVIISQFLTDHLHNPHWREVILLLLGKLRRKPVTAQLRQVLEGKSRLSHYTEILQQDLFFVGDCLVEEIPVDNELAEFVVSGLSNLIRISSFPSQISRAVRILTSLTVTRQYSKLGYKELKELIARNNIVDVYQKMDVIRLLYEDQVQNLSERQQTFLELVAMIQRADLSVSQLVEVAQTLCRFSKYDSPERQQAIQELLRILQRTDLTTEQRVAMAQTLDQAGSYDSPEQQQAIQELLRILQRTDLTLEQRIEVSKIFYQLSYSELLEHRRAVQELMEMLQRTDLTLEHRIEAAEELYSLSPFGSREERQAVRELSELLQRTDLTLEHRIKVALALRSSSFYNSPEEQQANQVLWELLHQTDLTTEQRVEVVQGLYQYSSELEKRWMVQKLKSILQDKNLAFDQSINIAYTLFEGISLKSLRRWIIQWLMDKMDDLVLTVEQRAEVAWALYLCIPDDAPERQPVVQELSEMIQLADLTVEQRVKVARVLYLYSPDNSQERHQVTRLHIDLLQRTSFTIEQQTKIAQSLYVCSKYRSGERQQVIQKFVELLQKQELTEDQRLGIVRGCTKRPDKLVEGNRAGSESVKHEREMKEKEAESEEEIANETLCQ